MAMVPFDAVRSYLDRRDDVRVAYVFGSIARGQARRTSDLDIAILFREEPTPRVLDKLTEELEGVAGRRVDVVALDRAPPLLAHEIVSQGRVLVCRDDAERVSFEARTASRFMDTAHMRKVQHAYLHERAEAWRGR